ncbi:MAG: 4Fe-4S binding protein [Olsenella sp.]|jgi:Na+-translocating ferredoxin:NAD+ oxidoreductase RNF subunit RnfB|nr:4Fe-4S binding protein [Olsenella sp.]
MTIVNFMPASKAAPVATDLLRERAGEVVGRASREDVTLLVPRTCEGLMSDLPRDRWVACDDSFGYVYANDTAAAQVLAGEKPLPSGVTGVGPTPVVGGEAWLAGNAEKRVYVGGTPVTSPATTTVAALLSAAGVDAGDVKAVWLGYPQCELVTAADLGREVTLSCDEARVYTSKSCMAHALAHLMEEFDHEGCGRCVFGHEGGHQLVAITSDICEGRGQAGDLDLIRDLAPVMADQALCEVGRRMAGTATQFLDAFGDEVEAHITRKTCPAGECRAFMTFHILVSKCVGCGDCLDACEDDAIMGKPGFVHVVDQRSCTRCGRCLEVCPKGAVVMAGEKKPKTPPRPIPCRVK